MLTPKQNGCKCVMEKSHALFHAVRLGPTFLDIPVCKTLITRKVPISRYFIKILLMHFGKYDQKLIELKIEHNVGQLDADRIRAFQQKIKSPWASNLPIIVFTYLLDEGYKQLANMMKPYRQVFHFLSAGPHVINYAPSMLRKNLKDKEDLILNKWFVPFPPRPKAYQLDLNSDSHIHQQPIPEEYPSKDGFENNRQLNVIAKGILIHPDLMNLWKQIGYYEIYDLVMQGALLILFPPTPASDWSYPSIEIGDFLWDAFLAIRSGENVYLLAHLPSNARAAEITIITATNTKKQLIWLLKSRNLFPLRSIFSSNRF
ncbi:uncharacterized protein OCT59_014803 [Rhizophagus irregularis]|uniref:uncharacterized protein n=1 Tax=Rhizophagus irregularis TaxID=588596 RepID=UPI000CBF0DF1|nr:hypothetical protein OCT59_014803 [Rhizophagus irregularis]GBC43975.1 hypothetical protein GLOIN_2v1471925 [Rhizophagus irregularis DAOM 181602=DAOM 197198]